MKKEFVALALLIAILTGNLWNQRRLNSLINGLMSLAEDACSASQQQDWPAAANAAEEAEKLWLDSGRYTHIFLRHTDIDALTAALCDFRGAAIGQESGELFTSYLRLKALLVSLRGMEKLSFGSVF